MSTIDRDHGAGDVGPSVGAEQQKRAVQFWEGKLYMLDRMIALAKEGEA